MRNLSLLPGDEQGGESTLCRKIPIRAKFTEFHQYFFAAHKEQTPQRCNSPGGVGQLH